MVLSKKKLKQKLRSLLTESISASESTQSHNASSNEELRSIKELLTSKSRKKPKQATKKTRKKQPLDEKSNLDDGNGETQKGIEEKKSKKRKDEENSNLGDGNRETRKGIEEKKSNKRKEEDVVDHELIERRRIKREKRENRRKDKAKKDEVEEKSEKASESVDLEEWVDDPTKIDESEIKKVYVGGIPYYSSEDDIRSFFEGCGTVTEMDCMTFPDTGKFRGIAFLTFKTEAAAKRALALDGADMGGFYLKIQPYKTQQHVQKSDFKPEFIDGYHRAYVGNLSWDITEDDLIKFFSDVKVSSIRFGTDKETGDFKGFAHVDFSDFVSLTVALTLDQKVVCGRPARISLAVPPKNGVDANLQKKTVQWKEEDGGTGGSSNKEEDGVTGGSSKKEEDGGTGGSLKKKKRRTCYVCGVPGHLSSACPRKKAAEVDDGSTGKS